MRAISFFLFLTISLWSANRAMVNLSDLDTEVEVTMDFYSLFEDFGEDSYFISAGALIVDDTGGPSIYFGRIFIESEVQGYDNVTLGLGIKPIHFRSTSHTFTTIPFAIQIDYALQKAEASLPLIATGAIYYGAERLTTGDAISYREYRLGFAAKMEFGRAFLQYRTIIPKYETGRSTFNETIYAGIQIEY